MSPPARLGGLVTGLLITAVVGVVAWLLVGQRILEGVQKSNARSGGGGPVRERVVYPRRLAGIIAALRGAAGSPNRLRSVTLRPLSVELVTAGGAGYRWRDGQGRSDAVERFAPTPSADAGGPWPAARLDPRVPWRLSRAIAAAEGGDFLLSIGDLQRASSGRLVWILRGRIGERGVAYRGTPTGRGARVYDPSSPALSRGAALARCIGAARGDPARLQRCAARAGG